MQGIFRECWIKILVSERNSGRLNFIVSTCSYNVLEICILICERRDGVKSLVVYLL